MYRLVIVRYFEYTNGEFQDHSSKIDRQLNQLREELGKPVIIYSSTATPAVKTAEIIAQKFDTTFQATDKLLEHVDFSEFYKFLKSVDQGDDTIIVVADRKYLERYFEGCIIRYNSDLLLPKMRILRGGSNSGEALMFDFDTSRLGVFNLW